VLVVAPPRLFGDWPLALESLQDFVVIVMGSESQTEIETGTREHPHQRLEGWSTATRFVRSYDGLGHAQSIRQLPLAETGFQPGSQDEAPSNGRTTQQALNHVENIDDRLSIDNSLLLLPGVCEPVSWLVSVAKLSVSISTSSNRFQGGCPTLLAVGLGQGRSSAASKRL